jgi:ribonuclease D
MKMDYALVKSDRDLINLERHLQANKIKSVAVDVEAEFNCHAYGEKVCLIQVFDRELFYIIDPFGISDGEVKKFLTLPGIVKYMYGAGSDIGLFYNQYGVMLDNVLDLQILADVLRYTPNGLSDILKQTLEVEIQNKKHFQVYDWTKRPIRKKALDYSIMDVKYLFDLYDYLLDKIKQNDLFAELIAKLVKRGFDFTKVRTPSIYGKKEFKLLPPPMQSLFRQMYDLRENVAKKYNLPPHNIVSVDDMLRIVNNNEQISNVKFTRRVSPAMKTEIIKNFEKILNGSAD